jgi:hypothetical protein
MGCIIQVISLIDGLTANKYCMTMLLADLPVLMTITLTLIIIRRVSEV